MVLQVLMFIECSILLNLMEMFVTAFITFGACLLVLFVFMGLLTLGEKHTPPPPPKKKKKHTETH